MATVLWQDVETGALDRCRLETGPSGLRLSGVVLTPAHGPPRDVPHRGGAPRGGLPRGGEVELDGGAIRQVLLADGAGHWAWEGGPELAEVAGSLDVDLTLPPATNTLPIRRRPAPQTARAADLDMAWVQFPALEVLPSAQRSERLAADRWRFATGDFQAELLVDPDGLVLDYGGVVPPRA